MVEKIRGNKSSIIFNDAKELAAIIKDIIGGAIKKTKKDKFNFKGINQYSGEIDSIYNKLVLRKERGLFLKLGYKCNNNCIFCVTGDNYPREFIDFNTLKETLTKDRELYSSLVLTGGEPTIRKDFFDILEIAYRLGYKILLQTNARMFSYKNFAELAKDFNLKLMINVNGHNAAIHDATTCVKGSFEQTIEGIRNLQRCGFEILCKVMLTKINYSYLLDTVKYITGLGIKEIWLVFLTPYGFAKLNFDAVMPTYSEVMPIVNQAILWLKNKQDIKIGLEGFPYCCINQDFHSLITEQNFDENSLDGIYPAENEDKYNCKRERILNQKQKTDECRECKFKNKCEGVYKEYINKVGVEEFKAIR
jgi:MoaA/NifB/PqqE/SkfB family radical SAM enzyme